jgi:hypothetical protein
MIMHFEKQAINGPFHGVERYGTPQGHKSIPKERKCTRSCHLIIHQKTNIPN